MLSREILRAQKALRKLKCVQDIVKQYIIRCDTLLFSGKETHGRRAVESGRAVLLMPHTRAPAKLTKCAKCAKSVKFENDVMSARR